MSYSNILCEENTEIKYKGEFVLTKNGNIDFGEISPEIAKIIKRQAGKIRLLIGENDSNNRGYGEKHLNRIQRLKNLKEKGYETARDFVEDIAKNYDSIYEGKNSTLILCLHKNYSNILFIELIASAENDFYSVVSGLVARNDYSPLKKKPLWTKSGLNLELERAQSIQSKIP